MNFVGRQNDSVCIFILGQGNGKAADALLRTLLSERGHRFQVLLFDNHSEADYRDALRTMRLRGWAYYISPEVLSDAEFKRWAYQTLAERHQAKWFVQLGETALPQERFLFTAISSWPTDPKCWVLSLTGPAIQSISQQGATIPTVQVETFGKCFLTSLGGIGALAGIKDGETPSAAILRSKGTIYQLQRSIINVTTALTPCQTINVPEPVQKTKHLAAFIVPTCHRPDLLRVCLHSLKTQVMPPDWSVEILVSGTRNDLGQEEALWAKTRWVESATETVTTKINTCLAQTQAELILLADDDDVQPPDRLQAAVTAYREGADWSGSGVLYFYHLDENRVVRWEGPAEKGLVGTSLSFSRDLLQKCGGWPERRKGKDGPMAKRVMSLIPTPVFADVTHKMGTIICHQHGKNLWPRPALEKGQTGRRGLFDLLGVGTLSDITVPEPTKAAFQAFKETRGCRIHVAITSYNRPSEVLLILKDIEREGAGQDVQVTLYDDGSRISYRLVEEFLKQKGWAYVRTKPHGKQGYLSLMLQMFEDARKIRASYNYFLQDDTRICRDFFNRTITLWDSINDIRKATLFLLVDNDRGKNGVAPWTGVSSVPMGVVNRTQWVDGNAFMFGRGLFQGLAAGCPPPPRTWFTDPTHGSGFGRQISKTLNNRGYSLYQVTQSYVIHSHTVSVMNAQVRQMNPLLTVNYIDGDDALNEKLAEVSTLIKNRTGVTVGVASIPSRRDTLRQVVERLLPQVDQLGVYLNNYLDVPDFLKNPKISVVRSQDEGDRGDAGKFFWVDKVQGYYFTCDDDLLYPPDYIENLLKVIEDYGRRVVVGVHGAILKEPLTSYYQSRKVLHFCKALGAPTQVHVLGTGTVAFHTSTIKVTPADFPKPNMADIWLAVLGQVQQVPFFCVPRGEDWLRDMDAADSIFNNSTRRTGSAQDTADFQTQVVQRYQPWKMPQLKVPVPTGASLKKAVFLVPTTNRPNLLRACLESLQEQKPVPDWTCEIRVIGSPKDTGRAVAQEMGITYIETPLLYPGFKLNAGAVGDADLWMAADDDDIQSPYRLMHSIKAFEAGHDWSSTSGIHYFDLQTGHLAFWKGPAALVGTTTSLSDRIFKQVGGWPGVSRGKESLLQQRLTALQIPCYDIGSALKDTVCLQHSQNIWSRPFPEPGTRMLHGQFLVSGLESDSDMPDSAKIIISDLRRRMNGKG